MSGCSSGEEKTLSATTDGEITLVHTRHEEDVAVSSLTAVVLEDLVGYRVTLAGAPSSAETVSGVASGEYDAYQGVWRPAQDDLLDRHEGDLNLLSSWLLAKTRASLAAPAYLDVRSLDEARGAGARLAFVLRKEAFALGEVPEAVFREHGLEPAYFADPSELWREAEPLYRKREPFVVLAYSPSWVNARYELDYLEGESLLREFNEPYGISSVARPGLGVDDPFAYAMLDELRLTEFQAESLQLAVEEADSPEDGAREWSREHEELMRSWVEVARGRVSS